jgi:hypothetical protein
LILLPAYWQVQLLHQLYPRILVAHFLRSYRTRLLTIPESEAQRN